MVTIKQVAERAGVSPTTASYAMNHRPEVKEETRLKVEQAARELNYIPNKAAQSFRIGRTNTISVLTRENIVYGNVFSQEFFGILGGAREKRYDVLVKSINREEYSDPKMIAGILGNRMCDGFLILGNQLDTVIGCILQQDYKGVLLSSHSSHPIITVNADSKKWIREMTRMLLGSGRKELAYFTYDNEETEKRLRIDGFYEAIAEQGIPYQNRIFLCGSEGNHTKERVDEVLKGNYNAIVCWNDILAVQTIRLLEEKGVSVPEQIAVTGFDGIEVPGYVSNSFTTVRQPFYEKGRLAVQLLVKLIEKEDVEVRDYLLECEIQKD